MQKVYKNILNLKSKHKSNIVFDTRILKENDIFIGLKTKKNDGNTFYKDAIKKKACLAIVNVKTNDPNIIYVKDTKLFINKFCKFILESYKGKIIAITGSVGKTTFKENIYHILKNNSLNTYRSFKNYNNILGLQFSIMNLDINTDFSIFELGINKSNEMTNLVKTLRPHHVLVTGIENSHIGNFRNFRHLIDNKLKIFNSDRLISGLLNYNYDPYYVKTKIHSKIKLLNINNINKKSKKIKNKYIINFSENTSKYTIESFKGSFYENIAIISFLFLKKLKINLRLKTFFYEESIIESRGKEISTYINKKKVKFFDHSYNASPYSLNEQILIFNERNINQKVYILGSMRELGQYSDFFHLQIIQLAKKLDLKKIIFIGEEFYKFRQSSTKFNFYKNYAYAVKYLNKEIDTVKNIFVMGSRYYQLDRIIKAYVG